MHIRNPFFTVWKLECEHAQGFLASLERAMIHVGVGSDWKGKLVGFECDGASVNIANRGLKGLLHESAPWVQFVWCLARTLELALKDALKNTLFTLVDEMLMQFYCVYEESAKKCREIKCVILELIACLTEEEMPTQGGSRPIRACGTHFASHKVAALKRLIDLFGAYLGHLTTLANDPQVKAADRQKMKGYILKWQDSKILLGCAFFHDLLRPSATLCKMLQSR